MRNTGSEGAVENATRQTEQRERRQEAMTQDRVAEIPRRKRSI